MQKFLLILTAVLFVCCSAQAQKPKAKDSKNAETKIEKVVNEKVKDQRPQQSKKITQDTAKMKKAADEAATKKTKDAESKEKAQSEKTKSAAAGKDKKIEGAKETKEAKQANDGVAKGKDKVQQSKAFAQKVIHEQNKHAIRVAKLEKMMQLAQEKGDAEKIEVIKKLMENEQSRFTAKMAKIQEQQAGKAGEAVEETVLKTSKGKNKKADSNDVK